MFQQPILGNHTEDIHTQNFPWFHSGKKLTERVTEQLGLKPQSPT